MQGKRIPAAEGLEVETCVLMTIDLAQGPIGSREIYRALRVQGWELSEATVSRRLRDLDHLGFTSPVNQKGRVLTALGTRELRTRVREREHTTLLDRVGDVQTSDDVIHLLQARRAIEPEAVREGVIHADVGSLTNLKKMVENHRVALLDDSGLIPRSLVLQFHRTITSFTSNPLVAAMTTIALDPSLDHVEAMLDVILESRHTSRQSVAEHAQICQAFITGDADEAANTMYKHLERLIIETTEFIDNHDSNLVDRFLKENVSS